jgi:alkylresorcinol/alkylpyrone synthase
VAPVLHPLARIMSSEHPVIDAVGRALPPHVVEQEQITEALRAAWAGRHHNVERLADLHRATRVRRRHLALPLEAYATLGSFAEANARWVELATELGARAIEDALARAGRSPRDVDHLLFVTTTGIATPSIDALLIRRLGLRDDVQRSPLFGLGCVAGVAGTARASDVLRAYPDDVAVVLSVELCSLTWQRDDLSLAGVIAAGLFGDGAAAAVISGARRGGRGPRVVGSVARLYPDTSHVMGWNVVESGLQVILATEVPRLIRAHIGGDVDGFLDGQGAQRADIRHWLPHPGGPRVLEAFQEALGLSEEDVAGSWRSMEEHGNLSSASALFVLGEHLDRGVARAGDLGLLAAMGPGFCAELVLLRWP